MGKDLRKISIKLRVSVGFLLLIGLAVTYQNCGPTGGSGFNITLASSGIGNGTINNTIQATNKFALAYLHSCAITATGGVQCWGDGSGGQLGYGSVIAYSTTPVTVINLPAPVTKITTGYYSLTSNPNAPTETSFNCALLVNGAVYCWGDDTYGQLGNGQTSTSTASPVAATVEQNFVYDIATSAGTTCAVLKTGVIQCWGSNNYGELGNGTNTSSAAATSVLGITNAVSISAGNNDFCATLSTGQVNCWGWNGSGQLGNQTDTESLNPIAVTGVSSAKRAVGGNVESCALMLGGTVSCWGDNTYGELGDGNTTATLAITPVINITGVTDLSVGQWSACALIGGAIDCWGYNGLGDLGDGGVTSTSIPTAVSHITTAVAIGSGAFHSCAYLSSGGVDCWGYNYSGQLGNGTLSNSAVPVVVTGFN